MEIVLAILLKLSHNSFTWETFYEEVFMSMELKHDERFHIYYYGITESEPPESFMYQESRHYSVWLEKNSANDRRLVNVIRHPDMSKNVLIHYFAVLKEEMG